MFLYTLFLYKKNVYITKRKEETSAFLLNCSITILQTFPRIRF